MAQVDGSASMGVLTAIVPSPDLPDLSGLSLLAVDEHGDTLEVLYERCRRAP